MLVAGKLLGSKPTGKFKAQVPFAGGFARADLDQQFCQTGGTQGLEVLYIESFL
jgi:hypothetical protein